MATPEEAIGKLLDALAEPTLAEHRGLEIQKRITYLQTMAK